MSSEEISAGNVVRASINHLTATAGLAAVNTNAFEVTVTRATSIHVSFLGLPAELRTQIYELVFTQDFHFHVRPSPSLLSTLLSRFGFISRNNNNNNNRLSLTQVNRQIYAETRLLHLRCLRLVFDNLAGSAVPDTRTLTEGCNALLSGLQPWQKCAVQHLELVVSKSEISELLDKEMIGCALLKARKLVAGGNFRRAVAMVSQDRRAWQHDIDVVDLEDLGHYLAARFPSLTALKTLVFAGMVIRVDRERVDRVLSAMLE